MLHNVISFLPTSWPQWLGALAIIALHAWLHFYLSRAKNIRANNLIEAIANSILAVPKVGGLIKSTPIIGNILQYLDTPEPVADAVAPAIAPPALPPAAVVLGLFWSTGLLHAASRLMLALAVVTAFGSCALTKKIAVDAGACALNNLPAAVSGIVPDVRSALGSSSTDDQATVAIENLAIQYGWATVTCAIEAVISDVANAKKLGRPAPGDQDITRRGRLLLSQKHTVQPKPSSLLDLSLRRVRVILCALGRLS